MKSFLVTVLAICCAVFLFLGNMYWKERTSISATTDETAGKAVDVEERETKSENEKDEPEEAEKDGDVESLISNWPEGAQERFTYLLKEEEPFKVAIVGSPALGDGENGWAPQLKETLHNQYGNTMEVTVFQQDVTSIDFINGKDSEEVLSYEPDLVLLEPFSLVDNSNNVGTVQNHESILMFMSQLGEANEESTLILQPPHPLAGATYYPQQIDSLKEFSEEEGIPYLDHWTAWPEDETLVDYLIESQDTPNEKGHKLWADYLVDYFVNE
jgi:hypothetical protein